MEFLTLLLPVFSTLITRLFPDKDKQEATMLALQQALNEAQIEADKAQAEQDSSKKDIITAEIDQNSWSGNWRAYLMLMCTAMIGFYWIGVPLLNLLLTPLGVAVHPFAVPDAAWTMATVGLGGYIGKETLGQYTTAKYGPANDEIFFDVLKQKVFKAGMTKDQIQAFEDALKARDGGV